MLDRALAAGIGIPDAWDIQTPQTLIEDGIEASDRAHAMRQRPSTLFVVTDRQAMGVVHGLLSGGLRVPEDVAVVGYDDIPYAACTQVPLTTVAIPMRRIGELSAEILFERLDGLGSFEPRHVYLLPELILRASSP